VYQVQAMRRTCFAITAPGLEQLCAAELHAQKIDASVVDGGVEWTGDLSTLYRANLLLRTASRVVVRLGSFRARGFPELERHAARIVWTSVLGQGSHAVLRVTSRKSRLYHEGAIAERLQRVLGDAGVPIEDAAADEDDERDNAILIIVRVLRDSFTISVDASGALLHQRGYRRAIAMAPLRETLAAAMLLASDWDPATSLLDPLCGSGTIPIEAALIARRIPPGLASADRTPRTYAFQRWVDYDADAWQTIVTAARNDILERAPAPIVGADRHGGAVTAARANAERAGVAADIEFRRAALSALEPPAIRGALVTNPPYGVRVGEKRALEGLFGELGRVARERLRGWSVHMLVADPGLARPTGLTFSEGLATRNGGIDVRLLSAHVGSGTLPAAQG
jgi:putative N6-adenine-specific DNA methylase